MVTLALQPSERFTLRQLLRWPGELYLGEHGARNRQLTGTLASIAIHSLLLWALLVRFNIIGPNTQSDHYGAMQLLQLQTRDADPGADAGSTAAPAPASELSDETSVQETALDTVVDTSVTPIWAVPTAAPTEPVAAPAQQGGIGSSSYDPYAGAALVRRVESDPSAMLSGPVTATTVGATPALALPPPDRRSKLFELDKRAFAAFRAEVMRLLAGVSGTVGLRVRVGPDGAVVEAQPRKGSLTPEQQASVARLIIGRALFYLSQPTADSAVIDLPKLDLDA